MSARNRLHRRPLPAVVVAILLAAPAGAAEEPFQMPNFDRMFGTWLWVRTDGLAAVSTPETRGARRRLHLNPDYTYEFHQRTAERDSVLCRGRYNLSEQGNATGQSILLIGFEGWMERYEATMLVDFDDEGLIHLIGHPCENCPEHTFARGRVSAIEGEVKRGERFGTDLWEGVRFELTPSELGWEIAVRDSTRPEENLARLTPPLHGEANPRVIEGWHFRNKAGNGPNLGDVNAPGKVRGFIFSREVGRTIQGPGSRGAPTEEEFDRVAAAGRGTLVVRDVKPGEAPPGRRAWIESMRFSVDLEERIPARR